MIDDMFCKFYNDSLERHMRAYPSQLSNPRLYHLLEEKFPKPQLEKFIKKPPIVYIEASRKNLEQRLQFLEQTGGVIEK